jgi:hypothetical protein
MQRAYVGAPDVPATGSTARAVELVTAEFVLDGEHMKQSGLTAHSLCAQLTLLAFSVLTLAHAGAAAAATRNSLQPSISGSPPTTATAGQAYSFTPTASAPQNLSVRFSITNKPRWAGFNTTTGELSGTPASNNVRTFSGIVISAHDRYGSASLPAFSITVSGGGSATSPPPVISGSPPGSVTAGSAYSFVPTASDPSGKALSFSVQNKPAWAAFSISTGALTGTPTTAQEGMYGNIIITASDGTSSAALPAFNISVTAPAGPKISGTPPATVTAGSAYTFTPITQDPSGGTPTFSVQNKPSWATFSATNGMLTGTPTAANVGPYAGIVISVSDGTSSAALPAFSITVQAAAGGTPTGSATLSWTAPDLNSDGSPLTNLAGYHIYYGTSPSSLSSMAAVAGAGATSVTIGNLSSTTWYFAIKSYTTSGVESVMSNVGSATIQ